MVALMKAGQGGNPFVLPVALWREVMGGVTMVVALPIVQKLIMVELGPDRPPQPAAYLLGVGQEAKELAAMARVTRGLAQGWRAQLIGGTQILQCFRCQGWGHMARECPIPMSALNQSGGN